MPTARLVIEVSPRDELSASGADAITFLLQPHGGSAPRPLAKGASGGELSRVMLNLVLRSARIAVAIGDLETAAARPIVQTKDVMLDAGYVYAAPSVSPDGSLFAYQTSGSDVSGGFVLFDENGKTVFRYPARAADPTPFWRPLVSTDGKQVLCYSPATSEKKKDAIYLIDRASGKRRLIAEGTHATFVDAGSAIVFEQWVDKWGEKARSDLWRLELAPGAKARKIVTNATQPAGQAPSVKAR